MSLFVITRCYAHAGHHIDHGAHAASPVDGFLPPQESTVAIGGDLGAPTTVATIEECAAACVANASCIAFSTSLPLPASLCGIREECWEGNASSCPSVLELSCPGGLFTGVAFASYGLPVTVNPPCGFAKGACDAPASVAVVEAACVGKSFCSIDVTLASFGGVDPCQGIPKFAAVALVGYNCSSEPPSPTALTCQLSGYSRGFALSQRTNATYYQRLQPRNDTRVHPAVAYALDVPVSGVRLAGTGLLASAFANNIAFLTHPQQVTAEDALFPYRRRHNASWVGGEVWGWDGFVPGSVASMLLMGAGGALRWTDHPVLRTLLDTLVDGIAESVDADGFAYGYPEADTNAHMNGNNQLPSYVNSWFTHAMLEAATLRPDALGIARGTNSWWNNNTFLPLQFPMDGGDDHVGPPPHGYNPAGGTQSTAPFAVGHMLYWMSQAGIGHSRMAMSAQGTQADVDFLVSLFTERWWLAQLSARNLSAIWERKWYPDNYEITALECYLDLYTLTGDETFLDAVRGGWQMFRTHWLAPGGSVAINENYMYPPDALPLEWKGHWGTDSRPTGEMCPSSFWILLNQRFHRLFPLDEVYVSEMEAPLINVGIAGQGRNGTGVRYFAVLHGHKETPTMKGTCCEGQSTRIFGAAPSFIFSPSPRGDLLSVDLYEASTISHVVRGAGVGGSDVAVNVTIATSWPFDTRVDILVTPAAVLPVGAFSLSLRIPSWAQPPAGGSGLVPLLLDGEAFASGAAGSYVPVSRAWTSGIAANVSYELAMAPSPSVYRGVTQLPPFTRVAYMFGPFLLATVGAWDASLDCGVINGSQVSGFDPLHPEEWLEPPPGTVPGALPLSSSPAFSVKGVDGVTVTPYYAIDGEQFTTFPVVIGGL